MSTAKRKEKYLRKDVGFRTHRAAISRYLAFLQLQEHCRPNSILHYSERLAKQQKLFEENLKRLVERVKLLQIGLDENYGIKLPFADPGKGEILDEVSVWLIGAQNALTKYKREQRLWAFSIWSENGIAVIPRPANGNKLDSFETEMVIEPNATRGERVLLRGVGFEYYGTYERPISLQLLPPTGAYVAVDRGGHADTLQIGRVFPVTPALDLKPSIQMYCGTALLTETGKS